MDDEKRTRRVQFSVRIDFTDSAEMRRERWYHNADAADDGDPNGYHDRPADNRDLDGRRYRRGADDGEYSHANDTVMVIRFATTPHPMTKRESEEWVKKTFSGEDSGKRQRVVQAPIFQIVAEVGGTDGVQWRRSLRMRGSQPLAIRYSRWCDAFMKEALELRASGDCVPHQLVAFNEQNYRTADAVRKQTKPGKHPYQRMYIAWRSVTLTTCGAWTRTARGGMAATGPSRIPSRRGATPPRK